MTSLKKDFYNQIVSWSRNEDQMSIGEKLKNLRIQRNLSMKELSKKSGLSIVSICGYETGKHIPSSRNISKLANALKCSFDELYDLRK